MHVRSKTSDWSEIAESARTVPRSPGRRVTEHPDRGCLQAPGHRAQPLPRPTPAGLVTTPHDRPPPNNSSSSWKQPATSSHSAATSKTDSKQFSRTHEIAKHDRSEMIGIDRLLPATKTGRNERPAR